MDALFYARDRLIPRLPADPGLTRSRPGRRLVLVTAHRRESFGADLLAIIEGLRRSPTPFPTSTSSTPCTSTRRWTGRCAQRLGGEPGAPAAARSSYLRFVQLLLRATLVITDSGGVQEEAAALGIPLLVARRTSERLEAVEAGVAEMVGPDAERIFEAASRLLGRPEAHARRAAPTSVFGDGRAAPRIAQRPAPGRALSAGRREAAAAAALFLLQAILLVRTARDKSDTVDEPIYLAVSVPQWMHLDLASHCELPALPRWGFGLALRLADPELFDESERWAGIRCGRGRLARCGATSSPRALTTIASRSRAGSSSGARPGRSASASAS